MCSRHERSHQLKGVKNGPGTECSRVDFFGKIYSHYLYSLFDIYYPAWETNCRRKAIQINKTKGISHITQTTPSNETSNDETQKLDNRIPVAMDVNLIMGDCLKNRTSVILLNCKRTYDFIQLSRRSSKSVDKE